jgi:uncharacterized protein (TIGR02996 family)
MTSERDAILGTICDHPDDNAPRLVYADWLDENGDPERAEFIRWQIEIANLDPTSKRYEEIFPKMRAKLSRKGKEWAGNITNRIGQQILFRRGFIEQISVLVGELRKTYDMVLSKQEPLRKVTVKLCPNREILQVMQMPHPPTVNTLEFKKSKINDGGLLGIASLPNIEHLKLAGNFQEVGLCCMADNFYAPKMRTLTLLSSARVALDSIIVLANAKHMPVLEELSLAPLGAHGVRIDHYSPAEIDSIVTNVRHGITVRIGGFQVHGASPSLSHGKGI